MAKIEKVYTLEELTELLHITRRSLYNYIKDGKLKAVKIGREWRVTEETLDEFLHKGTTTEAE